MNLYFDNAATTRISENALKEYIRTSEDFFANPSSVHKPGLNAHKKLDEEREKIASLLKVKSSSIVFTSGATESIASVISSLLFTTPGKIIISAIEHEAVSSWLPLLKQYDWECKELKARNGIISRDDLIAELTPDTKFIGIMAVNNVTGAIEPIKELVQCVRDYEKTINRKIFFFADSVQALGKIEYDLTSLDIDGASFSAHKINGPRGIGMLYLKNPSSFRPLSTGGGQEREQDIDESEKNPGRHGSDQFGTVDGQTAVLAGGYEFHGPVIEFASYKERDEHGQDQRGVTGKKGQKLSGGAQILITSGDPLHRDADAAF